MLNSSQFIELIKVSEKLIDRLAELGQASGKVMEVAESIAQACTYLIPHHQDLAQELDRIVRLEELLSNHLYPGSTGESAAPAGSSLNEHQGPSQEKMERVAPTFTPGSQNPPLGGCARPNCR